MEGVNEMKRRLEDGPIILDPKRSRWLTEKPEKDLETIKKTEEENLLSEIERMSAKDVQDYLVLTATSYESLIARILKLKSLQKIENGYYNILHLHGCIKFDEKAILKPLLKESVFKFGNSFINRVIKYASQFCYNQSELPPIMQWSNMMSERTEYDWQKAFNGAILSCPEMELPLYSSMIMLIPTPAPKAANRVFTALAKVEKLPPCFELLAKRSFQFVTTVALNKSDMEPIARNYLFSVYENGMKWRARYKKKPEAGTEAQTEFLSKTLEIANFAFGIIREGDETIIQSVLDNPFFPVENPTELFIEFFIQYVKLGMFVFDKGDKLIAWNYYYDDRWCGYDRMDLFGDKPHLTQTFKWCADFKFAGTISQHPHHVSLMLGSKVYEWMSSDPAMFERLMEKYESEDLIQYFAISLSFAGCYEQTLGLYERYKTKMTTIHGYLCLHICYIYSCAKEGLAKEGLLAWLHVMESAIKNDLIQSLRFPRNSFPLPPFVDMKYAAQFACRLLRNCLWTVCMRDGTEGWKKYGFILLSLCGCLEDSFLNYNMIRILFRKISLDDMPIIVTPLLAKCLRDHNTYFECLHIAKNRGFQVSEEVMKKNKKPRKRKEVKIKPAILLVYMKLRQLNEIFYEVMNDLPVQAFTNINENKLSSIKKLSNEKQEAIKEIMAYHKEKARKALEKKVKLKEKSNEHRKAQNMSTKKKKGKIQSDKSGKNKNDEESDDDDEVEQEPTRTTSSITTPSKTPDIPPLGSNGRKFLTEESEIDTSADTTIDELSSRPSSSSTNGVQAATSSKEHNGKQPKTVPGDFTAETAKTSEQSSTIHPAEIKQELMETEMAAADSQDDDDVMPVLERQVEEIKPMVLPKEGPTPLNPQEVVKTVDDTNDTIADSLSNIASSVERTPVVTDDVPVPEFSVDNPPAVAQDVSATGSSVKNGVEDMPTESAVENTHLVSDDAPATEHSVENQTSIEAPDVMKETAKEEKVEIKTADSVASVAEEIKPGDPPVQVLEREKEGDAGEKLPVDAHFVEADGSTTPTVPVLGEAPINDALEAKKSSDKDAESTTQNAPVAKEATAEEVKPEETSVQVGNEKLSGESAASVADKVGAPHESMATAPAEVASEESMEVDEGKPAETNVTEPLTEKMDSEEEKQGGAEPMETD